MRTDGMAMCELTRKGWAVRRAVEYIEKFGLIAVSPDVELVPDEVVVTGWSWPRSKAMKAAAWFGDAGVRRGLCEQTVKLFSARSVVAQMMGGRTIRRRGPFDGVTRPAAMVSRAARVAELRWRKATMTPECYLLSTRFDYVPCSGDRYILRCEVVGGIVRDRGGENLPYPCPSATVWYGSNWGSLRLVSEVVNRPARCCREVDGRRLTTDWTLAQRIAESLDGLEVNRSIMDRFLAAGTLEELLEIV